MRCPRCGHENPPSSIYCLRCNCNLQMDVENYRPDAQMTVILPSTPGKLEPLTPPPVLDAANDPLETIILDKPSHAPASKPPVSPAHALPSTPPLAPAAHAPSPVLPANSAPAQEARPAGQRATPNAGTILPVLQTEVLEPGAVDAALQARQAAAPTPAGAPQNRNTAPKSPPTRKQATSRAPVAATKQAATFSIVVGTASVVLLAVAVGFYLYTTRTTKAPTADTLPPVAMSIPVVAASKPAPPPPVQSEPVAPVPAVAAVSEAPAIQPAPVVEVAASAPPSVVTVDLTQAATPHMLKEAEITALLKDLKKRRPPEDCDGASRMLVSDHNVLPKQAGRIAKRAYPDLCAPAPKPTTDIASTIQRTPVQESAPPPAVAKARTLDEQYEERIGSECSKGAFGYVCREAMRVKLCGKLVENPPAGQSICKQ